MIEERRENVFTEDDRLTLVRIDKQCKEINGSVKRHDEELFGHPNHRTVGLVSRVRTLEDLVLQGRTAVRVVVALTALIGITNLLILFRGG